MEVASKNANVFSAVNSGDPEALKVLIAKGCDYIAKDEEGFTPLFRAVIKCQSECVRLLTKAALNDYSAEEILKHVCPPVPDHSLVDRYVPRDWNSQFPDPATPLSQAAWDGSEEIMENLIELYKGVTAAATGYALHAACCKNNIKCIELLLQRLPHLHVADKQGVLPIHYTARNGSLDAMKVLLKHGADVNAKDRSKITTLQLACIQGNIDMVKFLLRKTESINTPDCRGFTPLYCAVSGEHPSVVKLLLSKGSNGCVDHEKYDSQCVLDWATSLGNLEIMEILIGVAPRGCGNSSIQIAARLARSDLLEYLFKKGFPAFKSAENSWGENVWDSLLFESEEYYKGTRVCDTLKVLVENGTPLFELADFERTSIMPYQLHFMSFDPLRFLLDSGIVELQWNTQADVHGALVMISDFGVFQAELGSMNRKDMDAFFDSIETAVRQFHAARMHYDSYYYEEDFEYFPKLALYLDYYPFVKFEDTATSSDLFQIHDKLVPVVPKLAELCRWNIRCQLVSVHLSVRTRDIEALSLPKPLERYLLYKKPNKRVLQQPESDEASTSKQIRDN